MLDPDNLPADLAVALQLLAEVWQSHQIPVGIVLGGFTTLETLKLHGQNRVDALLAELAAAGVVVELQPKEVT